MNTLLPGGFRVYSLVKWDVRLSMIKRKDVRINKKLMVSFNDNGFDGLALTHNISSKGICVMSKFHLTPHHEIGLSLAVPGEILELKGKILWNLSITDSASDETDQVGIEIIEAPPEYFNYVEYIKGLRLNSIQSNA
jgi:hypothetical protein